MIAERKKLREPISSSYYSVGADEVTQVFCLVIINPKFEVIHQNNPDFYLLLLNSSDFYCTNSKTQTQLSYILCPEIKQLFSRILIITATSTDLFLSHVLSKLERSTQTGFVSGICCK